LLARRWLRGVPEFEAGWESELALYRQNGYVFETVHGRRRDIANGNANNEARNEIINFPIQSAAAALINDAMIKVADQCPAFKWGPGTGLLTQTHDSLMLEVPEGQEEWAKELLNDAFNFTHPSLPGVRFTGKASVGNTWKQVA
jgi:DNA polymerase I-like protein with 3'-5' exonuclease and polymerase domains